MDPQLPAVSVVIPCYNSEMTLAAAIQSALDQTCANVEVVVVNDGSTDGSSAVLACFADRVVCVEQPNRGLSAARNAGIFASRGEFVALLDADDLFLPDCLAHRVAILQRDAHVGLVAGYFREIDERGQLLDRLPERRKVWEGQAFRQAVRRNWGPPVGWTFRREAFLKVGGFDPLLRSCEDWDFVIRLSSRYAVAYDDTAQVLYRKSAGQMSSHHEVMLDAMRRVQLKNRAFAANPLHYWIDRQFGRFELGRRTLFDLLFVSRGRGLRPLLGLTLRHPYLIWVGFLAGFSFLAGKRASSGRIQRTD